MNIIHTQNAVAIKTKLYSINFKQKSTLLLIYLMITSMINDIIAPFFYV
mgnify:CR=1 FL=1